MSLTARLRSATAALSFAHLAGLGPTRPPAASRADDKGKDGADDDKPDDTEQDREDGDSKKGKKARRAEDGDDDPEAEEDEGDAAAAEDDDKDGGADKRSDDDEEEMRGNSAVAQARRRERARCAAIFARPEASRNLIMAAHLAFNTALTRRQAIKILRETPTQAAAAPLARTRRNPDLGPGSDGGGKPSSAVQHDRWVGVMTKARGGK